MKRVLGLLAVRLALGCAPEDVIVADVPVEAGSPQTQPCVGDQDCSPGSYCQRSACSDVVGQCAIKPLFCDNDPHPECGCDGVTYWNSCLRKLAGITAGAAGQCELQAQAATCGGPSGVACPDGGVCARLYHGMCDPDGRGTCWVMPTSCPDGGPPGPRWAACGPPNQACIDTCTAIASELPFRDLPPKACPP